MTHTGSELERECLMFRTKLQCKGHFDKEFRLENINILLIDLKKDSLSVSIFKAENSKNQFSNRVSSYNPGIDYLSRGIAGGGSYDETGSGTNYLCLPHDPDQSPSQFPNELEANDYVAHVWGAEYQYSFGRVKLSDDVPCAVCLDTKTTTSLMIPAKSSCPSHWIKQYNGFLCSNMYGHPAASEYACVDYDAQYVEGKRENQDGKLFYPVASKCGSLPCPPYENAKFIIEYDSSICYKTLSKGFTASKKTILKIINNCIRKTTKHATLSLSKFNQQILLRYSRWSGSLTGRTQLVYTGIAGGGSYGETGSGTNYLCLPHDPDQSLADDPHELERSGFVAYVWGAEYQYSFCMVKVDDDVPCAVCRDTTTETSLMIPAKTSQWKKQYNRFLCANMYSHPGASEYACVDYDAQYIEGKRDNQDGKLFYPVVSKCGSLPCPPYDNAKYMCSVCNPLWYSLSRFPAFEKAYRTFGVSCEGGAFYIRWGRKDCPVVNGTNLVYSGIAGGGAWKETGSGTNYLCLPHDPDFAPSDFPNALQIHGLKAHVWGAEYQFAYGNVKVDDDVPCAACLDTNAVTSVMIPGKNSCPATWTKQYGGFLCANHYGHAGASEYSCVDENPQYFEGSRQNLDGKLFYPVSTVCGSLPCPPYENSKYLKCVVCSR
ncbi:Hypothetical predicted protein [Mytilus galloprovincialis]|uniref:Uncharacterized protein n=1 Tax=Mytilus galloprovincialis TaxID=29158 RepID=A0A8B6BQU3_MYTGA|nr:Hypothetical predicted protein [Mytilus galloprovincialis]